MEIKDVVRAKYARAATRVKTGEGGCGSSGCCGTERAGDPITSNLYDAQQVQDIPPEAIQASLGCGNPTALAQLRPGETVLDLGSGGGIDVLLSARRVGPTGKAYGLDMTDEMLALARENQRKAGVQNVEFLKGEIENIPLPNNSVDVIISNCVINLSGDKDRVFAEAFRVLKPGGRFAVSDVVVRGEVPAVIRRSMELWVGCVAGALEAGAYVAKLSKAGFEAVRVEPTRIYAVDDAREFLAGHGIDVDRVAPFLANKFMSAFIRATKPHPATARRPRVLFLCTHNAARSQMAEGILRDLSRGAVDVSSAGTEPAGVHPLAVRALADLGFDITGQRSKHVDEVAGQAFDVVVTLCDSARESCPAFPGDPERIHWNFPDPGSVVGTEAERLEAFKQTARELTTRLRPFLSLVERPASARVTRAV